jgi:hypothetical protein
MSTLITSTSASVAISKLVGFFEQFKSQRSKPTLVMATVLSLLYCYSKSMPPRNIRHIPYVNYFKFLWMAVIQERPLGEISRTLAMPLLANSPMYSKVDRYGWTVFIADTAAAKQFFMKTGKFVKYHWL